MKPTSSSTLNVLGNLVLTASLCTGIVLPVETTSGFLLGTAQDGVVSFKGIPYAQAPVGDLRWEAPKAFVSHENRSAASFRPACIQQYPFGPSQNRTESLFNTPPLPEDEDCLYLNVWTPENLDILAKLPVMFWIHGGSLQTGSGSQYDGTSIAKNQNIIVVTINYRLNVFGFPSSKDLFPYKENLGFLDQELAMQWVQQNIAAFGGDPGLVTISGESAGSDSVGYALQRHGTNPDFRAAIMESGVAYPLGEPNFTPFDTFAKTVGCGGKIPGASRMACLKKIPARTISTFLNGPQGTVFGGAGPVADNITAFTNPYQRISAKQTARVPILIGINQDEGTLFDFLLNITNLSAALESFGVTAAIDQVREAYPGLNDSAIAPLVFRDVLFNCPTQLTATAYVNSGIYNIFRYVYGAVFADQQQFPGAGAWHGSEVFQIFAQLNQSTATAGEVQLSKTMQTIWANFIKDPFESPAPQWEPFRPDNSSLTLAKLAFNGNVQLENVVQPAPAGLLDGPCNKLWNN